MRPPQNEFEHFARFKFMNQIIIYEITAVVEAGLIEKYEKYMRERHIPDLLATGYFRGAKFTYSNGNRYRILYEAHNIEALNKYLEKCDLNYLHQK